MEKFEKVVCNYDGNRYHVMPKFIKRRVDALKKIQLEHILLQYQYNQKLQELELEFEKLYTPLYEKRQKIIDGEHEPTDEECQLPANLAENEFNGDQENSNAEFEPLLTEEEEKEIKNKVKGVPGFWLGCLMSTCNFSDSIEEHDKKVLRYLNDIRLSYAQLDEYLSYKLEFVFDENPYFSDKVLTKTYYLKMKPEEKDIFSYEGFEVAKSEGCTINWKPGMDVTLKTVLIKQKNKSNGQTRQKKKEIEQDSFFYFFKPPKMPEGEISDVDEELGAMISVDFELGEVIRQSIIPKAPLYYIGYMLDDEDDLDEEDDDDDESDDDDDLSDDDIHRESSSAEEGSSEEADSLNDADANKKSKNA